MGGCLSSSSAVDNNKPSAHVISLNGELRQYPVPVTVSQVLQSEASSSSSSSCFVCNSDRLYFDDFIPTLNPEEELQAGQIYFVLPKTKLQYKLSASDMAALAVKASVALQKTGSSSSSSCRRRKNKKARISPVILDLQQDQEQQQQKQEADYYNYQIQKDGLLLNKSAANYYPNKASGLGVSRSGSVRKLQRYSSRKTKLAVRSFRLRLSTIYEGSTLQFY